MVSSNNLFHFTNSLSNIKSILKEGFRVNSCKEVSPFEITIWNNKIFMQKRKYLLDRKAVSYVYIPMVSFCDIPLNQIDEHTNKYGVYGIGLKREWGKKYGLNPVFYINNGTDLAQNLHQLLKEFENEVRILEKIDFNRAFNMDKQKFYECYFYILKFLKNYKIPFHKNPRKIISSYAEHEWRYIPDIELSCNIPEPKQSLFGLKNKKEIKKESNKIKLTFAPDDIEYIIVKDKEIDEIRRYIDSLYKNESTKQLLRSKITSIEKIQKNKSNAKVSTDYLFHYTNNFGILKEIIQVGFKVDYCLETDCWSWEQANSKNCKNSVNSYIPMISLSDIDIPNAEVHTKRYGEYGIGVTKDWAIDQHINPVFYFDANSNIANNLLEIKNTLVSESFINTLNIYDNISAFFKNHEGIIKKKQVLEPKYKPYNEREWRYVPNIKTLNLLNIYYLHSNNPKLKPNHGKYSQMTGKERVAKIKLKPPIQAITHIIVKTEQERAEIKEFIAELHKQEKEKFQNLQKENILKNNDFIPIEYKNIMNDHNIKILLSTEERIS